MKVHTKTVWQMTDEGYELIEDESFEYEGEVSEAKGGGGAVQNQDPWIGAQPYLHDTFESARGISRNPTEYFPGETVAGLSSQTRSGINRLYNTPGRTKAVYNMLDGTAQGKYLPVNQNVLTAMTEPTVENIKSQFSSAGRYGSGAMGDAVGHAVGQEAMKLYDSERGRQIQAMGMVPIMDQSNTQAQLQAGGLLDAHAQERLTDQVNRWNHNQDKDWLALQRYASIVQPGAGMGGSTFSKNKNSSTQNAMGGLLAASAVPSLFGAGGAGSAALGMMGMF